MTDFQNLDDHERIERLIASKSIAHEHYLEFDEIDKYIIEII